MVFFNAVRSVSCLISQFHAIITLTLCVFWKFCYKGFANIQAFFLLLIYVGSLPPTPPHLYLPSQNGMKDFLKLYPRKHFHCGKLWKKKYTSKALFQEKKNIFFFLERLSNKAGALGKNISAGFAESNGKSTLFYYHFKPFKNFSMKGKKKNPDFACIFFRKFPC